MANKMLIDASHPEETRVVVLRGNRVQEFDFEAADKKPLRGNIYLAKVTRVEPSLQAAFVDYGGNRHGFLAFAEIHPDYYQIPVADRQALLEEESRAHLQDEEEERDRAPAFGRGRRSRRRQYDSAEKRADFDETVTGELSEFEPGLEVDGRFDVQPVDLPGEVQETSENEAMAASPGAFFPPHEEISNSADEVAQPHTISVDPSGFGSVQEGTAEEYTRTSPALDHEEKARLQDERDEARERAKENLLPEGVDEALGAEAKSFEDEHDDDEHEEEDAVEHIGGDAMDEAPYRASRPRRQYKIQEVIKRRQVLLVQVVKEERGNKGAALTTYLSLAGRYSVLMPNTARGGGISRKITDGADRKRLKEIVHDLEVPEGMGVILRTAGASRTKAEVKRDFEYLLRLWESVRELTLRSSAPMLVYEEGSLIKRAIRDLYGRDVEEIVVSGDDAYREAKDFMRMLMPSHAKNVRQHREAFPIFADSGVEAQLDAMFSNHVTLKSGGYLVINQTEALVAIDVNSGRSTREHNIEDTALRTNLEAADEVARQLRLRDLAGLIVVDFIDMEEGRNNRAVERRVKEALKNDRARIQVGRISHFGLLEMSRQRIRAGVIEGSTVPCPHCLGAGHVRSTASIALHVLRVLEEALVKSAAHDVTLRTRAVVALYILNQKRAHLHELERRFGVHITVAADDTLTGAIYHALERGALASGPRLPPIPSPLRVDSLRAEAPEEESSDDTFVEDLSSEGGEAEEEFARSSTREDRAPGRFSSDDGEEGAGRGRRRRRRRGRGGINQNSEHMALEAEQPSDEGLAFMAGIDSAPVAPREPRSDRNPYQRNPRHAERGAGRWRRSATMSDQFLNPGADLTQDQSLASSQEVAPAPQENLSQHAEESFYAQRRQEETAAFEPSKAAEVESAHQSETEISPQRETTEVVITEADPNRPKKGGWWQRVRTPFGG
jgi:ribonuclease E